MGGLPAGRTPLMAAAWSRSREVVELLMGKDGVDVDKADSAGHTALLYVLLGGDEEIVDKIAGKTKTKVGLEDTYHMIARKKVKMTEALGVFVRQTADTPATAESGLRQATWFGATTFLQVLVEAIPMETIGEEIGKELMENAVMADSPETVEMVKRIFPNVPEG